MDSFEIVITPDAEALERSSLKIFISTTDQMNLQAESMS